MKHINSKILVILSGLLIILSCSTSKHFSTTPVSEIESTKAIKDIINYYFKPFTDGKYIADFGYVTMNDTLKWRQLELIHPDSLSKVVKDYKINTKLLYSINYGSNKDLESFFTNKVKFVPSSTKDDEELQYLFSPMYKIGESKYLIQCRFYSFELQADFIFELTKADDKYNVSRPIQIMFEVF